MEEKQKMKVSLGTVICIVIIVILLATLGGVLYYYNSQEHLSKKEIKQESVNNEILVKNKNELQQTTTINESNDDEKNNNESQKISVLDAVNHEYNALDVAYKVKLPRIVGKSAKIDELNEKILNESLPYTYDAVCCREENEEFFNKGHITTYRYTIKNNILVIYVYDDVPEGGSGIPATNSGLNSALYCYDIENDKILTIEETGEKLNLKTEDYLEGIPDYYAIYKQLDKDTPSVSVDGTRL